MLSESVISSHRMRTHRANVKVELFLPRFISVNTVRHDAQSTRLVSVRQVQNSANKTSIRTVNGA